MRQNMLSTSPLILFLMHEVMDKFIMIQLTLSYSVTFCLYAVTKINRQIVSIQYQFWSTKKN